MRTIFRLAIITWLAFCTVSAWATDRYVAQNGQTPASPFTDWTSAASNIQDAINAAVNDDTVWVGAGLYLKPTNAVAFEGTNVVYIDKRLSLRSSNSVPSSTIIDGEGANRVIAWNYTPASPTNRFLLDGFTIRYGFATNRGAGIFFQAGVWTGVVQNCIISSNTVAGPVTPSGAGVYSYNNAIAFGITLSNCLVQGNIATNPVTASDSQGGGVWLQNRGLQVFKDCTIEDNRSGSQGGGMYVLNSTLTLERCIVRNNRAPMYLNAGSGGGGLYLYSGESLFAQNCLFYGNLAAGAGGAIASQARGSNSFMNVDNCTIVSNSSGVYIRPQAAAQSYMSSLHIVNSIVYSNVTDISLGASGDLPANYSSYASNCCLGSTNSGVMFGTTNLLYYAGFSANNIVTPPLFVDFRSGDFRLWPWSPAVDTGLTEPWMTGATDLAGQPRVSVNGLADMGCYETTAVPHPAAFYAAQNGQTPTPPYTNWVMAASNIQDAIDIASDGDTVWIGAGRYRGPGSGAPYNSVTNIIYLNKPVSLRGAGATRGDVLIDGEGAYRSIHVSYAASTTNRFVISGLTVTNSNDRGILFQAATAGVIWTAVVDNCAVVNCKIGGINDDVASPNTSQRTIIITNSLVRGNLGPGININFTGGAFSSVIADTTIERNTNSGAAFQNGTHTLSRCIIRDNTSPASSGGLSLGIGTYSMDNCLVARNTAAGIGGAIYKWSATGPLSMVNCTIVSNISTVTGPGGIRSAATNPIVNSVIYCNYLNSSSAAGDNVYNSGFTTLTNCLAPGATGSGNISVPAPAFENFAGGDYRLCAFSSGVDTGLVQPGMESATDLAGQSRLSANGLVDMGCYETSLGTHPGYYVAQAGQTPVYPYTNWPMAASNIQDAVDAYVAGYNTTIWVGPGRYTATTNSRVRHGTNTVVDIYNKAMTLRGYSGNPNDTIVDGEGKYRCLYFSPSNSVPNAPYVIDGFTFTNGYAIGSNSVRCAGVYIGNELSPAAWTARVQNCVITDNRVADIGSSGGSAGGIYSGYIANNNQDFTFVVSNCVIRNNSTNGMYYLGTCTNVHSSWTIVDSRFENNTGSGLVLSGGTHWNAIRNCRFVGNTTYAYGAGAFLAVPVDVVNCLFASNQCLASGLSNNGGGAMYLACPANNVRWPWAQGCNLINCTVIDNFTASNGVAVYQTSADINCLTLINTIVWSNRNWNGATANHYLYTGGGAEVFWTNCLSTGLSGPGNIITPVPAFENYAAGDYRLKNYSSGVDAGVSNWWIAGSADLAGQPRIGANGAIDMGAYETSYEPHPGYFVAQNGQTPVSPYTNLTMAASNIQDAVYVYDTIYPGTIWVAPATYTLPPNPVNFGGSNIVYIDRPVVIRGTSGNPADTILDGQGTNRAIAIYYGTAGKEFVIDGFTITNCHGYTMGGGILLADSVGGYSAPSWTGRVVNCRILNNTVSYGPALAFQAAGAYGGGIGMFCRQASGLVISNCVLRSNLATNELADPASSGGIGGGIYYGGYSGLAWAMNSLIHSNRAYRGGGAYLGGVFSLLEYCELSGGRAGPSGAQAFGGGIFLTASAAFRNCLITGNDSPAGRGAGINHEGSSSNTLVEVLNCTIARNSGGGVYLRGRNMIVTGNPNGQPSVHLVNSLIYSNTTDVYLDGPSDGFPANYSTYASNCCFASTNVMVQGTNVLLYAGLSANNTTNNPRFANYAAGNYRVAFNSPCVNAGLNQAWMVGAVDADGMPRISPKIGGTVDIGAYEYPIQGGSVFTLR